MSDEERIPIVVGRIPGWDERSRLQYPRPDEETVDEAVEMAQDFIRRASPGMRTEFPDPGADWPEDVEVGIEPTEYGPGGTDIVTPIEGLFAAEEDDPYAKADKADFDHRRAFEDLQYWVLNHPVLAWLLPSALVMRRLIAMRDAGNPYARKVVLPEERPGHVLGLFHRWTPWGDPYRATFHSQEDGEEYRAEVQIRLCTACHLVTHRKVMRG